MKFLWSLLFFITFNSCTFFHFKNSNHNIVIVPLLTGDFTKIYLYDRENNNDLKVILVAKKSQVFKEGKYLLLDNIRLLYFYKSKKENNKTKYIEVVADKAKFNYETLVSESWNNVKITGFMDFIIETDYVYWDGTSEIFKTKKEDPVYIYRFYQKEKDLTNKEKDLPNYVIKLLGKNVLYDFKSEILEIEDATSIFKKQIFQ